MKVSITTNTTALSDLDLQQLSQLGVDKIDFGNGHSFHGVSEQGFPDLDELLKLKKRIRSWGMDINRVTLPNIDKSYMENPEKNEQQVKNSVNSIKVFSEAGIDIVRQRFEGDVFYGQSKFYEARHRGDAIARGESLGLLTNKDPIPSKESLDQWWNSFRQAYKQLVETSQDLNVKLAMHPSDTPHHNSPFDGLGLHRIVDQFPNENVGFVYCIGTRAEAGGSSLVMDEINHFGRKNRIFLVHFRNVRGSLATAGAFEEAMLDDGDLNMYKILLELKKVGFDGCLNPDHVPIFAGDEPDVDNKWAYSNIGWKKSSMGFAYSVGYIKALINAMNEFTG